MVSIADTFLDVHMLRRGFLSLVRGAVGQSAASPSPDATTLFGPLLGRWVRKDGGYVITIKGADLDGKLDASYANPSLLPLLLPFSTAVATSDGGVLKLFFELRAGGYNGSTYTLAFDAVEDRLKGIYYQAVAKQKFDVVFERTK
jgi:hypothetical protein